jgi:hypothetical protein
VFPTLVSGKMGNGGIWDGGNGELTNHITISVMRLYAAFASQNGPGL